MKRLAVATFVIVAAAALGAQTLTPTGGGGSIKPGSTPAACSTAKAILFSDGSLIQCSDFYTDSSTATAWLSNTPAANNFILNVSASANLILNTPSSSGSLIITNGNAANITDINAATTQWSVANNYSFGFSPSSNGTLAPDTAISRGVTAGVLAIGTGAAGNAAGGLQTGNATLTSLTTGTNADFLCLSGGGAILIQSTACTISSLRFKPDWKPYTDDALTKVSGLDVGTFHLQTGPNADPNAQSMQAGLSAESIATIAPECAIYENDMKTPKSYRQECVLALLVKAIQELKNDRHHQ